jgi:hypothetical protein
MFPELDTSGFDGSKPGIPTRRVGDPIQFGLIGLLHDGPQQDCPPACLPVSTLQLCLAQDISQVLEHVPSHRLTTVHGQCGVDVDLDKTVFRQSRQVSGHRRGAMKTKHPASRSAEFTRRSDRYCVRSAVRGVRCLHSHDIYSRFTQKSASLFDGSRFVLVRYSASKISSTAP